MRWWRYVLEPNEWGISFELDFHDTTRQTFREPRSDSAAGIPPGRRNDVTTGFESFGEVEGWVQVGDTPHRAPRRLARHPGPALGGGPRGGRPGAVPGRSPARRRVRQRLRGLPQLDAVGGQGVLPLRRSPPGFGHRGPTDRRLRFEPDTHIFVEGIVDYTLDTGEVKQVHYERIGHQTAYLRCGMYGGTPDGGIHQGGYDGPDLVEGETYDVTQPEVRARLGRARRAPVPGRRATARGHRPLPAHRPAGLRALRRRPPRLGVPR